MNNKFFGIPDEMAHLLTPEARAKAPDLNVAIDLGQKASNDAREAIKRTALLGQTSQEAGIAMMIAAIDLYHHAKRGAKKAGGPVWPIFQAMDVLFAAPDGADQDAAYKAALEAARRARSE